MDQAPTNRAVTAPLPDELRPYIVLHAENAVLPNGSRFGGHWVTAWRCRVPFVQIDAARSHAIGRCVPFAGDGDDDAMRRLLADAACLIAADETWLELAAEASTPTIYLADGHLDKVPPPAALQAFDRERLRVLRSDTNFRRDLPLRSINEALEHFVPGVTGEDRSESSLCRGRLAPYLNGRIADLGHGGHKVHPDAIGVDFFKFDPTDWIGDVRDLWFFESQSFDSVYSSHCLEDLWHPHQALDEWTRILKPGGHLSLFLPLRDFYPNVGTEGANPGHKDDYVPEDVERFLRELGHVDIVHSARVEAENSFEVVARKQAARSFFFLRDTRPRPQVSVLVVADPSPDPGADAARLCASIACATAAFANASFEVLVLDRTRGDGDGRAAVRDLAARDVRVHVLEDRRPLPYAQRWELLRRRATGEHLLVLQPGTLLEPGAGDALVEALADGAQAAVPLASDPLGATIAPEHAAASCLLLEATAWPANALEQSPYHTGQLWCDVARSRAAVTVPAARAITSGERARPIAARGSARRLHDERLHAAATDPMAPADCRSILVVMLRTLGDCVLATPVLDALRRRHANARIEVLTERSYGWIFAQHDAVDTVLVTDGVPERNLFLAEDRAVATALEHGHHDRLILLSDRLENVTYHHSGLTLADFYALQAGVPEACGRPPALAVPADAIASWQRRRDQLSLSRYAIVHTRAGWSDKSPAPALCTRIVDELAAAGIAPVVVGGPGERVDHPAAIQLAGELSPAESAAAIADAELFVGPDSGPLHIASALGVKSLALYGGSHLWVAPPRAHGSCSVQATSCCPVPCGVTPCPERHCGADGLAVDAVLPRLRAVIDDGIDGCAEYWGHEPARCVPSADGPQLHRDGELPDASATTRRTGAQPRLQPAPIQALPVELGQYAIENHARLLEPARQSTARADDTDRVLEALRGGVEPALGLDVLRALMLQCREIGADRALLQTIAAAISHCGEMVRGERGRTRPAFRLHAGEVLHRALNLPMPEPFGTEVCEQLFALYERELGVGPDLEHVLVAATKADDSHTETDVRDRLLARLREHLREGSWNHHQVLRHATTLRCLQDVGAAVERLDAHLAALPLHAHTEAAETRFLRGTCLVAAGRPERALDDMRSAANGLSSAKDRQAAGDIAARLEQHLATVAR